MLKSGKLTSKIGHGLPLLQQRLQLRLQHHIPARHQLHIKATRRNSPSSLDLALVASTK